MFCLHIISGLAAAGSICQKAIYFSNKIMEGI